MEFINKLLEKLKKLDGLGKLSLVRWGLLVLAVICVIICEVVEPGIALSVFAILLWLLVIAFLVLSIIIFRKKKKAKANKSY